MTITGQFQRPAPSRVGGAIVRLEPGARTAWHVHLLGWTLIVTEGVGWPQIEGGTTLEFRAGDVLWCAPGRKHWHGATPYAALSHIAIQEGLDGSSVTWMEKVTDGEYLAGRSAGELMSAMGCSQWFGCRREVPLPGGGPSSGSGAA